MSLFEPTSIAVIGASGDEGSVGHDIFNNLLTQGYEGNVYPVNPKRDEILGKKVYASIREIDGDIDLAIIVVPAKIVPVVLEECREKFVNNIVIISAGFAETQTKEGIELENQIKEIAQTFPTSNIIGPNCLGILNPKIKLNASFATAVPPEGGVALISQSGATAVAVMDASANLGIGYSLVASIGNKTVMDECDLLEIARDDKQTKMIGFYLENISDGKRFLSVATACQKPIVLLKAGVSEKGGKAASSHTGALAGNDAGIEALCKQSGIVRAHTSEEFLDLLEGLSTQPQLASPNIAIVTNAGGPGILATDAAQLAGLLLPKLNEKTETKLRTHLPAAASTANPIDVIGDAGMDRYEAALEAVGDSPNIDGLALLLTPQGMTPVAEIAEALISWRKNYPMMPVVTCLMGEEHVAAERLSIQNAGIPSYETPERALNVLGALLVDYESRVTNHVPDTKRAKEASAIIGTANGLLNEETTQKICDLYGINMIPGRVATSVEEAITMAREIGYPVIAKIASRDILHKTDIGGIRAELATTDELIEAWNIITNNAKEHAPNAHIDGILIQKMVNPGDEFIVGATKDSSFGHLVMAGLGGIYTEVLQDTSFRIAPIDDKEAYKLLTDLHSWKVLLGARGKKQLHIDGLVDMIVNISNLVTECPQIKDIDVNPVFVHEDAVIAADVKIVIT